MSGRNEDEGPFNGPGSDNLTPQASLRRSRISLVWLIPIVALLIAGYLGFRTLSDEGPTITVQFSAADGLTAGQTKVRHKAVDLGQVESIRLSDTMNRVIVRIRMAREAVPYLTNRARFWVVRPRLSSGSLAGIETIVSGSYIEMDPGGRDGDRQTEFTGLEQPPGVRSSEPGSNFALRASRIGSLSAGAPVFYRDINVGEVLGYDIGDGIGPVTINVFVRAPFDAYVREGSHFWNASGLSVRLGADGVRVELASLQAVLNGGVAFDAPKTPAKALPAGTEVPLYENYAEAQAAGFQRKIIFVTYFSSAVRGLTTGSAVEFYGIQVGTVQEVKLEVNNEAGTARVRVVMEIQPERIVNADDIKDNAIDVARRLIKNGLRVQTKTSNYLTGQLVLSLDFLPNTAPADLRQEGGDWVLPSVGGGIDNILTAASDISAKLDRLPLEQIGANLNSTLRSASGAMLSIQDLVKRTDASLTPALHRLPEITAALQDVVVRAGRTVGSIETGYGQNSQFSRELERAMTQVGDTARAIRVLADYLDRHPEALVRGRAGLSDR